MGSLRIVVDAKIRKMCLCDQYALGYDITPLGRTSLPAIEALRQWGAVFRGRRTA